MGTLQADLDEMLNEAKHSEEKSKKAMVDAARLADELRTEHEHYTSVHKSYKSLEVCVKELEAGLSDETNRYADCMKNFRKCERRIKELVFQSEEDKKNYDRMQDLVDKLQVKIKTYK